LKLLHAAASYIERVLVTKNSSKNVISPESAHKFCFYIVQSFAQYLSQVNKQATLSNSLDKESVQLISDIIAKCIHKEFRGNVLQQGPLVQANQLYDFFMDMIISYAYSPDNNNIIKYDIVSYVIKAMALWDDSCGKYFGMVSNFV